VDGVRVLYKDGWGLLRASNTQPVLVMRFEASSQEALDGHRLEMDAVLQEAKAAVA
jgi:phosphomannomutase/phosphoglucomutase